MIYVTYEHCRGGTNNLAVAIDGKTGFFSTSLNGEKAAISNLKKALQRRACRLISRGER